VPSASTADPAPAALAAVICTHARPGYLAACLAGLAAQDGPAPAVLVVDSASRPTPRPRSRG
jgi:GT2 family glycosyltransferase